MFRLNVLIAVSILSFALVAPLPAQSTRPAPVGEEPAYAALDADIRRVDEHPPDDTPTLESFRLPANAEVRIVRTDPDGEAAASALEQADSKLVYSNSLGRFALTLPTYGIVADDITTLTPGGCALRGYSFQVVGKANPAGLGGSYFIEYGLYDNCPGAVGPGATPIPGTRGTLAMFDDTQVVEVHFAPPPNTTVTIPSTVWLGIKPSRANVGVGGGAPARVGFSQDVVDYPGETCHATAGLFPSNPHASFNAEVYVDGACADAYPAYLNLHPDQLGFNPGPQVCFADDLQLNVPDCLLTGYEVGVLLTAQSSSSVFIMRMFRDDGGLPGAEIAGTRRNVQINTGTGSYRLHVSLATPVLLDTDRVWFAFESTSAGGGWILTRKDASVGHTAAEFAQSSSGRRCSQMLASPDWQAVTLYNPVRHGGFDVGLQCAGKPPVGACCDMYLTDDGLCDTGAARCVGGEFDGDACFADLDCKGDPKCRNLPEMNCPFPPPRTGFNPKWQAGKWCRECVGLRMPCETQDDCLDGICTDTHPFGEDAPCGVAACCVPDSNVCANMTEKECTRLPPAYAPNKRQWQIGRYCDFDGQNCPPRACLSRQEPCDVAHEI